MNKLYIDTPSTKNLGYAVFEKDILKTAGTIKLKQYPLVEAFNFYNKIIKEYDIKEIIYKNAISPKQKEQVAIIKLVCENNNLKYRMMHGSYVKKYLDKLANKKEGTINFVKMTYGWELDQHSADAIMLGFSDNKGGNIEVSPDNRVALYRNRKI